MATLRKRSDKWQVQIRRLGHDPVSRSFANRKDAETWARDVERRLDIGEILPDKRVVESRTLGDLLTVYRDTRTPGKKSERTERSRINKMLRNPIATVPALKMTSERIALYRDKRLAEVSGETTRQDLVLMRQVFEVARKEWGLRISVNPVNDVRKPPPAKPRTRRVHFSDLRAIAAALKTFRNPLFREVILFALATGMRRGEILRVEWKHIDWKQSVLEIPVTKNRHPRTIPLTRRGLRILTEMRSGTGADKVVFPISANALRLSWQRLQEKAKLDDLRFHDMRHEAVSRFFEAGLSLSKVALISGHRDPKMLMRYTHLDASKIAAKLNI